MTIKIFGQTEPKSQNDVYLQLEVEREEVMVNSVTKKGEWLKTLLYFTEKGLIICADAENAGFPTTKQGRIKIVK